MSKSSETNWARVDALRDEDIGLSDIPALDEAFFENATLRAPRNLVPLTVRLDPEVVDWFKSQGADWEDRLNAALRIYARAHQIYRPTS